MNQPMIPSHTPEIKSSVTRMISDSESDESCAKRRSNPAGDSRGPRLAPRRPPHQGPQDPAPVHGEGGHHVEQADEQVDQCKVLDEGAKLRVPRPDVEVEQPEEKCQQQAGQRTYKRYPELFAGRLRESSSISETPPSRKSVMPITFRPRRIASTEWLNSWTSTHRKRSPLPANPMAQYCPPDQPG